jgi:diphosphomevalonate decarboxylase
MQLVKSTQNTCFGKANIFIFAYRFDAGPNAVLYTPKQFIPALLQLVDRYFPKDATSGSQEYFADPYQVSNYDRCDLVNFQTRLPVQPIGSIKRILHARIGTGPQVLYRGDPEKHKDRSLISANGNPKLVVE